MCVIISCSFLCCCLQKFTKQKREIGTSVLLICETAGELYDGQFLKFLLSNFEAVLHILFGTFLTLSKPTEWIQLLARFVDWILSRFFNRRGLWRCYRCCWSCFLLFGQQQQQQQQHFLLTTTTTLFISPHNIQEIKNFITTVQTMIGALAARNNLRVKNARQPVKRKDV